MAGSNSVFISYRRGAASGQSAYISNIIWRELQAIGVDAFYDVADTGNAKLDERLFREIEARPYFMLLLMPGTLDRCVNADDWVRQEIVHALNTHREIVIVNSPEFDRGDFDKFLPPKLSDELERRASTELPYLPRQIHLLTPLMEEIRDKILLPIPNPSGAPISPQTVDEWIARSHELRINGKYSAALTAAESALALKADSADAFSTRAKARWMLGDLTGAIVDYTEAIRLRPDIADNYYNRGLAYRLGDGAAKALSDLDEALRLKPMYPEALLERAMINEELHQYEAAIDDLANAIRLQSNEAIGYLLRANVYKLQGENHLAANDYRRVLEITPTHPRAAELKGFIEQFGK
jgi:tetratricopeptide (TPR) repeat protein